MARRQAKRAERRARVPYQADYTAALKQLEARRLAGRFTLQDLAERADMGIATLRRLRRTGRAFRRQVQALKMALRSLERDRRGNGALFAGD